MKWYVENRDKIEVNPGYRIHRTQIIPGRDVYFDSPLFRKKMAKEKGK